MDNLLQKIRELVEAYNGLPNAKKMILVEESLVQEMNLPHQEDFLDVTTLYLGIYNEGQVALFKELCFSSPKTEVMGHEKWSAGSLYIGYENNLLGIKTTHEGFNNLSKWQIEGDMEIVDKKRYVCNCNMKEVVPFDEIRTIMYEQNEISSFTFGKATKRQICETLSFAKKYYADKIIISPQKTKK